jgi:hypothetical protein
VLIMSVSNYVGNGSGKSDEAEEANTYKMQ